MPKPVSTTSKVTVFTPATPVKAGDIVTGQFAGNGWHVVLKDHITGMNPLKLGESTELAHYAVGPS